MTYDYTYSDETTDDGIRIRIVADDYPENPRRMWDNAGVVAFHVGVDYDIGDETYGSRDYYATDADIRDYLDGVDVLVIVPLRFRDYGSSGAILRADDPIVGKRACRDWLRGLSDEPHAEYNGVAFLDAATVRAEWRSTRAAASYLAATVGELACYVAGDVYGLIVDVPTTDLRESVWGFYCEPDSYVMEEARHAADAMLCELESRREAMTVRSVN